MEEQSHAPHHQLIEADQLIWFGMKFPVFISSSFQFNDAVNVIARTFALQGSLWTKNSYRKGNITLDKLWRQPN